MHRHLQLEKKSHHSMYTIQHQINQSFQYNHL
jgi:hypothetical protein